MTELTNDQRKIRIAWPIPNDLNGIQYGSGSPVSAPPDYHDQTGITQTQPATSPDSTIVRKGKRQSDFTENYVEY